MPVPHRSIARVWQSVPDELSTYLADLPGVDAPHTDGTLLDHLLGTFELLSLWKAPKHVCEAGLFHSVYGTESHPTVTVAMSDRLELRRRIGRQSERLVLAFHSAQWSRILSDNDYAARTGDANAGLYEIAVANLIEQTPRLMLREDYRKPLLEVVQAHLRLSPWLSEFAIDAIARTLAKYKLAG